MLQPELYLRYPKEFYSQFNITDGGIVTSPPEHHILGKFAQPKTTCAKDNFRKMADMTQSLQKQAPAEATQESLSF